MLVTAIASASTDDDGMSVTLVPGRDVELSDARARQFIEVGLVRAARPEKPAPRGKRIAGAPENK